MKQISTNSGVAFKKFLVSILTILSLAFGQSVYAHSVDSYSASCVSGPQYKVTAVVSNVNNTSNYRWQWKNTSNAWVCFVNGNNTINGNTYNVTGSVYNLTTTPGAIVFTNPNSGLQGLQIRMVISDGNGVNPCTLPANNTWTSATPFTINVNSTPCATCTGKVTSLYFNKLDGGTDLAITNGATFTIAQLGSLYNLEAATTGTVGSVKFTVTGPTPSTNTENSAPYNSPATGGAAWTGAAGTYTLNVKVYSDVNATGNLCDQVTITFIIATTGSIGDKVWYDTDRDGLQDNGEAGIMGVTVKLRNAANAVIATDVTDASGNYLFTGLAAGNYTVEFPVSVYGYKMSPAYVGTNRSIDSDPSVTTGVTPTIALTAGQNNLTIDAGYAPDCACTTASSDLLVNGSFENGTTGWSWSSANGSLTTGTGYVACGAANGFNNQSSGTSKVWQDVTMSVGQIATFSGYAGTHTPGISCSPKLSLIFLSASNAVLGQTDVTVTRDVDINNSQLQLYTITATAPVGTAKARVQSSITCNTMKLDAFCLTATPALGSIGDRVWYDTDRDGIQDNGENGINGVTVKLRNAANVVVATDVTDANGNYSFTGLAASTYSVEFPATVYGYILSPAYVGTNRDIDSDPSVATGVTPSIALATGQNIVNIDAGYAPDCACVNSASNLLVNGNFENGTTGWSWSSANGSLTTGTGYIACGAANGFNNQSSGTSKVWQDVNVAAGSTVVFKGFAGTHTPGITCAPTLSLIFLNAANTVLSQSNVTVTRDVDINNSQLEQYSITAVAPNGTTKVRVQSAINCNTMKIDAFCLTVTNVPLGSIGDRVWNDTDADGIQDAGEVGVAGITLVLLNSAGQPIASTTTDAFGNYNFGGSRAGNYSVRVTPPANYSLSAKTQGSDTNLDNDFDPITYTTGTVTLTAGQNRTDIDAGLKFTQTSTASVGDRVWLDLNADGVQDAGEPGVSNVLVTLYNSSNVAVRYTYTNVNGNYLFTDVAAGSYTVGVSLPPAFVFTTNSGAVSGATNSDIVPATGRTASFTVNAGDQITYVDAGIKTQTSTNGSIGDFVWNDINKNGFQEPGEPGISGVTVRLLNGTTNAVIATTVTDVTGEYIFNDVPAGDYKVEFVTPAGFTTTTKLNSNVTASGTDSDVDPATSRTATFTLAAGQRIVTVDAGYWLTTGGTGKIGDRVWLDANQNGIQDAVEANVQGMTVTLYDAANTAIKTAVTDANGNYLFTDLAAGNYTVGFSNLPAGFTFTTQGLGTAATGSDANPATGKTATIALAAGQTNLDVDAGIRSSMAGTASIGNRVWSDLNNNGLQDAIEPGIEGVTVELLDAAGNPVDKDPATAGVQPTITVTNALGEYLFTGLAGGDYKVRFSTLPAGYNASPKAAGTNRDIDSDGNTVAGGTSTTDIVSVATGEERLDIDFGLFSPTAPLGQLGDRVWFDSNNNGLQDATEQGVPGVTVSLLNASSAVVATTVTDANGLYNFVNLAAGTYSVKFSNLPAGFTFSPANQGANDAIDSDADGTTGVTGTYTIAAGTVNTTCDAGIYSTRAALGDYVFFDANSNGIQDATEKGIAGVTVTLYDAANVAVTSAITDQNGKYFFSNLNAGTYTVGFGTTPGKLVFTAKDVVAAGDAADSDVDPATGKTGAYSLVAGQVNLTVDAGLKPFVPATVGDYVWFDLNRDGLQTADEPGVPGAIATLYNAANQPVGSAITDGNGYYLISNVPAGTGYYVVFSNTPDPSAPFTLQNVGGTAASDNSKADATGKTTAFSVANGQNVSNIDAGVYRIINISGHVWNDANGLTDLQINKTGTQAIPNSLNIYLVDAATNQVIQLEGINQDGTYNFLNVDVNHSYKIVLSNLVAFPGQTVPAAFLPSGWQRVGENLGAGPLSGSDGQPNGVLFIDTETNDVYDANFGIRVASGEVVVG